MHWLTREEETRLINPSVALGALQGKHILEQELELSLPTALPCSLQSRHAFPPATGLTPT